ncbi:hypothetical protein N658DRAFT_500378 [Parathielavia hyrcaniae]|uniref:Uncharacterized protein n=1 Tax=Parathielavia hyrcaniae TaxID=113614 RepID=A0AAN6PVN4_9PEZI|nr:hypothetical protein N658DRAFT_500378 [Parathielavia hyrcaniae]
MLLKKSCWPCLTPAQSFALRTQASSATCGIRWPRLPACPRLQATVSKRSLPVLYPGSPGQVLASFAQSFRNLG